MGRIEDIYETPMTATLEFPDGVVVVAQPEHLAGLDDLTGDIVTLARQLDAALETHEVAAARIVVIEVDPGSRASLERVDRLRNELPSLPIIAGLAKVDIATTRQLMRRGVADVVALPFSLDELVTAVVDTAERIRPEPAQHASLAPCIAVLKTIGGSGATTIATHLAAELAQGYGSDGRACIIDLDLQSGDASSYLGCAPSRTLTDILESDARLDEDLFRSIACKSENAVDVVAAPRDIVPIESVEFEKLMRIIEMARKQYDVVLLDLPATFTNWSVSTIFAVNHTLLVGLLTIPSLRHAKRQVDFLKSMGVERNSISVVLNRVENRMFKAIDANDAEDALKHPILATVAEDTKLIRNAQDQGLLAQSVQKRSKFGKDIGNLADQLEARLAEAH